jgi:hypothetical protein
VTPVRPLERLAAAVVRIDEERRGGSPQPVLDRREIHAVSRQHVALGLSTGWISCGCRSAEPGVKRADERDVEPVEPDDRLIARVAVVVEGPPGRDDEVAGVHRDALAVDRCAPCPSRTNRSADFVWRLLGAISPGRISCKPA